MSNETKTNGAGTDTTAQDKPAQGGELFRKAHVEWPGGIKQDRLVEVTGHDDGAEAALIRAEVMDHFMGGIDAAATLDALHASGWVLVRKGADR